MSLFLHVTITGMVLFLLQQKKSTLDFVITKILP